MSNDDVTKRAYALSRLAKHASWDSLPEEVKEGWRRCVRALPTHIPLPTRLQGVRATIDEELATDSNLPTRDELIPGLKGHADAIRNDEWRPIAQHVRDLLEFFGAGAKVPEPVAPVAPTSLEFALSALARWKHTGALAWDSAVHDTLWAALDKMRHERDRIPQFHCPKCGGHCFSTSNQQDWSKARGHCEGHAINGSETGGCGFTWSRQTQDLEVFR